MNETVLCSKCGAANEANSKFCSSCAAVLTTEPTETTMTEPIVSSSPSVTPQSPRVTEVHAQPKLPSRVSALSIIALIFGIISLLILSWVTIFSYLWMPYLYLGIAVVGLIISIISVRSHIIIGIISIAMNSAGALVQLVWILLLIILKVFIEFIGT